MIVGYQPGTGPLHRAHPFTVLAVTAAAVALAFVLPGPTGPVALMLVAVLVALVERVPRVLIAAAVIALPVLFFAVVLHGILGDDPTRAVTLGARITAMVIVFLVALTAVHPGRLVDALLARGAPFEAAYLFSATLQAVPRLRTRAAAILDAQRCRGLQVKGSIVRRVRAIVPLAVPLVLGALGEADERAMALEARGARSHAKRTPLSPPADSRYDKLVRWLLLFTVVGAIALRVIR